MTTVVASSSALLQEILNSPDTHLLETADQDTTAADFLAQDEFGGTASTAEDLHDQDVFLKEAFAKGLDLREYANHIERELEEIEESHITDYMQRGHSLVALFKQIQSCDGILGGMEEMLSGFQGDLGKLSQEIQTLQDQSFRMSYKLKNRLTIKQLLGVVLDGITISPEIVKVICDADVNDLFTSTLNDLNRKMTYVKQHHGQPIRAFRDVGPEMEKLRLKATEKSRSFLLEKIKSLAAPNANVSIIQQSILLRYKSLHHFVILRHQEAATELRFTYIQFMGGYIQSKFLKYIQKLQKLQSVIADKYDMLGADDGAKKTNLIFGSAKSTATKPNLFTIGDRMDLLSALDSPVIVPHTAEESQQRFPFESIFRSISRVLMDNASSEYCFILEFFGADKKDKKITVEHITNEVFGEVFGKTLKSVQDLMRAFADSSFDALGLLLCIRINAQHQLIMQKRRIPCLDLFINATNLLLWPRFQSVMDMHINSVKKATTGGGIFGSVDVTPHFITRRYAEFAVSILSLNEGYDDPHLLTSLSRLRQALEELISRMVGEVSEKKKKLLIYINNYDLLVGVLDKSDCASVVPEKEYFVSLLDKRILEFVDEELNPQFGALISFVKEMETVTSIDSIDTARFEKIAQDFSNHWRPALNEINTQTMQLFNNFKNGSLVVQMILRKLVEYYQVFSTVWEQRFPANVKLSVQPVSMHQLVVEIKTKYKKVECYLSLPSQGETLSYPERPVIGAKWA